MDLINNNIESTWFVGEVVKQQGRVQKVNNYKKYLIGKHKVLNRKDFYWKKEKFTTTKLILQNAKTILDFHTTFLLGKPLSLTGSENMVKEFNKIYRKFNYNKLDFSILKNVNSYGDCFEYVYRENGIVKSKLISPNCGYPVYDGTEMTCFIEHWTTNNNENNYNIYYKDKVEYWKQDNKGINMQFVAENPTGLPIHYKNFNPIDDVYGRSDLDDLIPIFDCLEDLLSKMQDAIYTLSLNPIATLSGSTWEDGKIDTDIVGSMLELEGGSVFDFKNAQIDFNTIKLYLDALQQQLSVIAKMPTVAMGNTNVANVSEVSLKMLYNLAIMKALESEQWLRDGLMKRFKKIEILMQGLFADDDYIDIEFNYNIPINRSELLEMLYKQWSMGAMSIRTVIEKSDLTKDVDIEIERLEEEKQQKQNGQDDKQINKTLDDKDVISLKGRNINKTVDNKDILM